MLFKVMRLGSDGIYINTEYILTIEERQGIVTLADGTALSLTYSSLKELLKVLAGEEQ